MTFGEARTRLRNDILAEASTDYYTDADLLGFLQEAAEEIALNFGFPTGVSTASITTGDSSFTLATDAANVDLHEVAFEGFNLTLVPYQTVASHAERTSIGYPRYYNWDPKRGGVVYFAPKAPAAGTMMYEYVKEYDASSALSTDPVWNGLFPAYQDLVVFRAGHKAFDASLESDRAQYWLQREQARSQEFAAFLNKTPVNRLMGEEVAPS